jgi:hypothetical protein
MKFPSFSTINVQYATYLSFNIYRNSDNSLIGTLTRNYKPLNYRFLYDLSFASGKELLVSTTPSLCSDVFLAQDCLNSSDSGDSY